MTDHKAEALRLADPRVFSANKMTIKEVKITVSLAQVHATLHLADQVAALVEQQRIANLSKEDSNLETTLWNDHTSEGLEL